MFPFVSGGAAIDFTARMGLVVNTFDDLIDHGKAVQHLGYGVIDEYEDETGVDTGASSGQTYDSGDDLYTNPPVDACTGGTASASGNETGYEPAKAFADDGTATFWAIGATSGILAYDFATARTIVTYTVQARTSYPEESPSAWTFEVWNGASWDVVDTVSSETGWSGGEIRTFTVSAPAEGTQARINVTAVDGGSWVSIAEMTMIPQDGAPDMTLISEASTAGAPPSACQVTALLEPVSAVTLGDDIVFSVSADDGATWSPVTMTDFGDHGSGISVISGVGVPGGTGTDVRYKVETANGKQIKLRGVGVLWD